MNTYTRRDRIGDAIDLVLGLGYFAGLCFSAGYACYVTAVLLGSPVAR